MLILPSLLVISLSACGSSDASTSSATWGDEAEAYFQQLSQAFTDDDVYGVLDFYSAEAEIADRTSDFLGATVPVSDWLASHRADLSRDLLDVHLGADQAVSLVAWPGSGDFGAIVSDMDTGLIDRDTILVDLGSLERSLRASPELAGIYQGLYTSLAQAWSTGNTDLASQWYAPGATVSDPLGGVEAAGWEAIARLVKSSSERWESVSIETIAGEQAADNRGTALFLDPISYGRDPQRAIGLYRFERDGCSFRTAVLWVLDGGEIVDEYRYPELESFRRCTSIDLIDGWWTGLRLPEPRDRVVTGTIQAAGGRVIEIRNGSERLDGLVRWGLEQFVGAGLARPQVDSVTFEPTRRCEGVFGRVDSDQTSRDLVLCIYEQDLCGSPETCDVYPLAIRAGMLHELGHVWLLDHTDEDLRAEVLELSGRDVWAADEVPWVERGVEYAAEVLSWGLNDEEIRLERLGDPPCEQLAMVYEVLTGDPPRQVCVGER